ncbi:membrane-spanning 4-domains subfamily A member 4A-like isoform X1 [Rhineura floridana]|uniref:membrane-spanning 4-domains subfamily A member 4A-like isoform X1 n=1 Tax=Rhineura floridana TaxID=261503 RepID=UPI002AC8388A|nr:membrane-spanning 4-domains subfamily A member 4A-like isoform X1 [Rhineura floridana]XP_061465705.1 membrane-spanning 4-domains subfamily A member 4A-like isoform X1 [Rhineura floridana]XP_061465706.1 membrane-spanning 4-domains subfamily A member 4A-like isoform X1 [Rhineura floridana]
MSEAGLLLQRFLRGHPRVFGTLLVVIGLFQMAFGVILFMYPCVYRDELGTHFYSAALLILAGILTLAADKANNLGLVKACLAIYILCTIVVAVINIFYLIDLLYNPRYQYLRCSRTEVDCEMLNQIAGCCTGMRSIVLILTSLGFFICISMAAFGCKAVCRQSTADDDVPIARPR